MTTEDASGDAQVHMFDDPIERDPQSLSFEETFENLNLLNRRLVTKLNEHGLDQRFEVLLHNHNRRKSRHSLAPGGGGLYQSISINGEQTYND